MLACVHDGIQECMVLPSTAGTNSSVLIHGCWSKGRVFVLDKIGPWIFFKQIIPINPPGISAIKKGK